MRDGGRYRRQATAMAWAILIAGAVTYHRPSQAAEPPGGEAVTTRPSDPAPDSRPAGRRAGVALVDWALVVQSHPRYATLERTFADRRAEIQKLSDAGEKDQARKLSEETEALRKQSVADLFKDIDQAIKIIADRDHYDVVTSQVVFLQEGIEVPDITAETLENLKKITVGAASRPATTQAVEP